MKRFFAAALAALLIVSLCAACAPKKEEPLLQESPSGSLAPIIFSDAPAEFESVQFDTKDLAGNAQTEKMFAEHELTLVNVWATWCSPCIEELPILDKIYREGEIGVVGIVIESRDDDVADFAAGIVKKSGATYPVLRVTEGMEKSFLSGIDAMPTTFFVDGEGNVVGGLYIGAREEIEWRDTIASVQEKLREEK